LLLDEIERLPLDLIERLPLDKFGGRLILMLELATFFSGREGRVFFGFREVIC